MFFSVISSFILLIGTLLNAIIIDYLSRKSWNQKTGLDFVLMETILGNVIQGSSLVALFLIYDLTILPHDLALAFAFCLVLLGVNFNVSSFLFWTLKYLYIVHGNILLEVPNQTVRMVYLMVKYCLVILFIGIDQFGPNEMTRNPLVWTLLSKEKNW